MEKVFINALGKWIELDEKSTICGEGVENWLSFNEEKKWNFDRLIVNVNNKAYNLHSSQIIIVREF